MQPFHFLRTKTSRGSFLSALDAFQTVAQQSGPGAPCARLLASGDECEDDRDPVSLKQDAKLSPSQGRGGVLKPSLLLRFQSVQLLPNMLLTVTYSPPGDLCDITNGTARSSRSLSFLADAIPHCLEERLGRICFSAPLRHRLPSKYSKKVSVISAPPSP